MLRIKLRYEDAEAMVQRFAPNVGKSGLFLPTKSLQPVGAEVKFELRLANDQPVLLGLGKVKVTREPDPANPKASFGMAIELMRVTRESRDLILRMLERRKQMGLPEVGIPMPADLDAARRGDVDTGVKDAGASGVPQAVPLRDSAPVIESRPIPQAIAPRDSQPSSVLTAPRRSSGPLAVAKVNEIAPLPPEPPRKKRPALADVIEAASGPVSQVTVPGLDDNVDVGAALARARLLATGDLDAELDALREAAAAPIAEIGVEAASAELARQLGGSAVRRWSTPPAVVEEKKPDDAKVEPIEVKPIEVKPVEVKPVEVEAEPEPAPEPEPVPPAPVSIVAAPIAPDPIDTVADPIAAMAALDQHDAELHTPVMPQEMVTEVGEPIDEHEVEPEQIHDEIHQLGENDYEEVEHTHIGQVTPPTFDEHVFVTTPSDQHAMAERLDQHLAEVEAESEHDDLGIGEASGRYLRSKIGLPPAEIYDSGEHAPPDIPDPPPFPDELPEGVATANPTLSPEYQQDFIHHFRPQSSADPEPAYDEPEQPVEQSYDPAPETIDAYGQTMDAAMLGAAPVVHEPQHGAEEEIEEEIEEINDFEILAEADEEDADLLSSSGEADASGSVQLPPPSASDFALPAMRNSDFAMRLDLGDDEPEQSGFTPVPYDQFPQPEPYPQDTAIPEQGDLAASAGIALAGFEDEDESAGYTFAETPHDEAPEHLAADSFEDEGHSSGFSPPGRFDQSDVIPLDPHAAHTRPRHDSRGDMPMPPPANEPYVLRGPPPGAEQWDESNHRNKWTAAPPQPASEEIDLESALQALDVDLDDLSVPHASTELARGEGVRPRATIRPPSSSQIPADTARKPARGPRAGSRAPRAASEDGVLIDFDDDDEK